MIKAFQLHVKTHSQHIHAHIQKASICIERTGCILDSALFGLFLLFPDASIPQIIIKAKIILTKLFVHINGNDDNGLQEVPLSLSVNLCMCLPVCVCLCFAVERQFCSSISCSRPQSVHHNLWHIIFL